jgi:hypothetical protein
VCGGGGASDVLLNVILYVPIGVAVALCGWRRPVFLLAPLLLSVSIECAQRWIPGRDPSLGDVVFNTLGAACGMLVVRSSRLWLCPPGRVRLVLAAAAGAAALVVLAATGFLLEPAFPRTAYWVQWTPDLGHLAQYQGRVLSASLGPLALPSGRVPGSERVRELLLARAPLRARAVAGPRVSALAPLVSIVDEHSREIFLVGPDRDDLVLRYRTRAATVGLDQPDVRAEEMVREVAPADSLRIEVRADGDGFCLVVNGRAACGRGFTLGRGWALLYYPESFPPWLRTMLDDAWLAGLLVPLGFWIDGRGLRVALIAAVIAALWVVPRVAGLLPTSAGELAGAVVGFCLGLALRRLATRRGAAVLASAPQGAPGAVLGPRQH